VDGNGNPVSESDAVVTTGFTGHEHDEELGLVNMRGRIYDPDQRRFLTPDPLVPRPTFGQSYNRYTYVLNNPLAYTDPSGYQAQDDVDKPTMVREEDGTPVIKFPPDNLVANPPVKKEKAKPKGPAGPEQKKVPSPSDGTIRDDSTSHSTPTEGQSRGKEYTSEAIRMHDVRALAHGGCRYCGYEYVTENEVGSTSQGVTPETAMAHLQFNPNAYFPFDVVPKAWPRTWPPSIQSGAVYDLRDVRFPFDWGNHVVVENVTSTSFTFRTLPDHFDGPDALITFTTYEKDGKVYLQQEAYAPLAGEIGRFIAPLGARGLIWPLQAFRLKLGVERVVGGVLLKPGRVR
jgi:RHS repeat-associated protein